MQTIQNSLEMKKKVCLPESKPFTCTGPTFKLRTHVSQFASLYSSGSRHFYSILSSPLKIVIPTGLLALLCTPHALIMYMFKSVIGKSKLIFRVTDFSLSNICSFLFVNESKRDVKENQKKKFSFLTMVLKMNPLPPTHVHTLLRQTCRK